MRLPRDRRPPDVVSRYGSDDIHDNAGHAWIATHTGLDTDSVIYGLNARDLALGYVANMNAMSGRPTAKTLHRG